MRQTVPPPLLRQHISTRGRSRCRCCQENNCCRPEPVWSIQTTRSPPWVLPSRHRHFFFNDTATTEIYTLSLHDALPIYLRRSSRCHLSSKPHTDRCP